MSKDEDKLGVYYQRQKEKVSKRERNIETKGESGVRKRDWTRIRQGGREHKC